MKREKIAYKTVINEILDDITKHIETHGYIEDSGDTSGDLGKIEERIWGYYYSDEYEITGEPDPGLARMEFSSILSGKYSAIYEDEETIYYHKQSDRIKTLSELKEVLGIEEDE